VAENVYNGAPGEKPRASLQGHPDFINTFILSERMAFFVLCAGQVPEKSPTIGFLGRGGVYRRY
jgi:hypothetical protein